MATMLGSSSATSTMGFESFGMAARTPGGRIGEEARIHSHSRPAQEFRSSPVTSGARLGPRAVPHEAPGRLPSAARPSPFRPRPAGVQWSIAYTGTPVLRALRGLNLSRMASSDGIALLRRAARRAGRRARAAAVLSRFTWLLPIPLGYAVLVLTLVKALRLDAPSQRGWWLFGVVPLLVFLVGVGRELFTRRQPWGGSIALDQFHGFHDRVTSALSFSQVPAAERTPLMQAAIEDGVALAGKLDPRRAVPIGVPRELGVAAALLLGLGGLSQLEVRRLLPLPPPPSFEPMVMSADDIDLFRDV